MMQQAQQGRSLTEMLGVLAVIGVLSITAILGYRIAINKYRANETTNEIKIIALNLSGQIAKGQTSLSLDETGDHTRLGYVLSARMMPKSVEYFEIHVGDVPVGVCKEMLRLSWILPTTISVGIEPFKGNVDICGTQEKSDTMIYVFQKDLQAGNTIEDTNRPSTDRCNSDNDCKCGSCYEGMCESNCPKNSACVKSYDDARWLVCCKPENVMNGMCCASIYNGQCCTMMGTCCPQDKPLRDKDNKCYSCDDKINPIYITGVPGNCDVCPNRQVHVQTDRTICSIKCPPDKPLSDWTGRGIYYACDDPNVIQNNNNNALINECQLICPNRVSMMSSWCYPECGGETPLRGSDRCYACDYTGVVPINLNKDCTTICPNRQLGGQNNAYCVQECPPDKPVQGVEGWCYACSTLSINITGVKNDGNCAACPDHYVFKDKEKTFCVSNQPCPDGSFRQTGNGTCVSCTTGGGYVYSSPEECAKCPEREYGFAYGNKCVLKCGMPGTSVEKLPLPDYDGVCYSCDMSAVIGMNLGGYTGIDKCTQICPNRKAVEGNCVLSCSPERPLMYTNGACYACDAPAGLRLNNPEDCSQKCSNRFLNNAYDKRCVGCGMPGTSMENKPLFSVNGDCFACDYPGEFQMGTSAAAKETWHLCTDLCPNRKMENGICSRKKCSVGKDLVDKNEDCYPCNIATSIDVGGDKAKCDKCINREMQGKYCVLK